MIFLIFTEDHYYLPGCLLTHPRTHFSLIFCRGISENRFLGYPLDAKNCCFVLTQEKLVKCGLIVKVLSLLRSIKVKLCNVLLVF